MRQNLPLRYLKRRLVEKCEAGGPFLTARDSLGRLTCSVDDRSGCWECAFFIFFLRRHSLIPC